MTATLVPFQKRTSAFATVSFYEPDTTTPQAAYANSDQSSPITQVDADENGDFTAYLLPSLSYRIRGVETDGTVNFDIDKPAVGATFAENWNSALAQPLADGWADVFEVSPAGLAFVDGTTELAALDTDAYNDSVLVLQEDGQIAIYDFESGDKSAGVTAGTHIAPNSDLTGASGAWLSRGLNGVNDRELSDYYTVRHSRLSEKIFRAKTPTIPVGISIGNSIVQGTGSGDASNKWPQRVGAKLQSLTGLATTNDWSTANYGIGGCTTATVLAYVADNNDTTDNQPQSSSILDGLDYILIMTMRNDVGTITAEDSAVLIRATLTQCIKRGVEPIFVMDPPKFTDDTCTVLADDVDNQWTSFYQRALSICGELGVTVVDAWRYFRDLHRDNFDMSTLYSDSTHPNENGYELIGELVYQAMIAPSAPVLHCQPQIARDFDYADVISAYDAYGGSVTTTTDIGSINTKSTSRRLETSESANNVFVLSDGDTIQFRAPGPVQGFVVLMLGDVAGTVTATYNSAGSWGPYQANTSIAREKSYLVTMTGGVTPHDLDSFVTLTSSGESRILGVLFLCSRQSSKFDRWTAIGATETGSWADGTLVDGEGSRESSTVGDTATFMVYGSQLILFYERGVSRGKFTYAVDSGSTTEVDAYLNASSRDTRLLIELGESGWHEVEITVTTKNASASNNIVSIGKIEVFDKRSNPTDYWLQCEASTAIDIRATYTRAELVETYTGSPVAHRGISGNTFTLGGSGSALVRLTR